MSVVFHRDVSLTGLSYHVPERRVTNQEIIDRHALRIKSEWISQRIGISERRWASEDEAASDLAVGALKKLEDASEAALFISTISADYLTPSTASLVKQKMNWRGTAPALDLSAACAGQIFGLEQAAFRLHSTNEESAYCVATEVRSRYLNPLDRRTVFLFGDGACAMKLTKNKKGLAQLQWTATQTMASDEFEILVPAGGSRKPLNQEVLDKSEQFIRMNDGSKIMEATTGALVEIVQKLVKQAGSKISDFKFVVFHQGNSLIIKQICESLAIDLNKTFITFGDLGNSSSASCGIALARALEKGLISSGNVLLVTMGAGYHVGLASLCFESKS